VDCDLAIDALVAHVNSSAREPHWLNDAPALVRVSGGAYPSSDDPDLTEWRIVATDNSARISALEQRLGRLFPPSFRSLICRYSFPSFEFGPIDFFSNTGEALSSELEVAIFADPVMSPQLLSAGYLQIGRPWSGVYDPICIEAQPSGVEGRVVEFCHEGLLCNDQLVVLRELSASFLDLVSEGLAK
jgi:hypothetical protein